jgi:hypothetical protein
MMRPIFASLLAALVMGAMVFGAGWAVQAGVLPAPQRASLIAARAAAWLYRYRLVDSTFSIGAGSPVHATCVQTWFPTATGGSDRGTVLRLGSGSTVITVLPHHLDVLDRRHREPLWLTRAQLELAGCPRLLADTIAGAAQSLGRLSVSSARAMGRHVLLLHVLTRPRRLIVYLASRTGEPIGLSITDGGWHGHSVIRLARVTPALLSTRGLR